MTVPTTHEGRVSRRPSCATVRPPEAAPPESRSTFVTPRCWYWAPNDMNTAPMRASGMPMSSDGLSKTPTSASPTSRRLSISPYATITLRP